MLSVKTERGRGHLRALAPRPPGPPLHATLRELLGLLAALSTLTLLGWAIVRVAHDLLTPDPVAMPVPAPGSRTVKLPLLINIAIDDSASMGDSDPDNRRWGDVAALGRWLARYQRPDDLVAITRFGDDAVTGPVVSSRQLAGDPRRLAPAPSVSGTAFMPVVNAASRIFSSRPGAYKILILLTDGNSSDAASAVAHLPAVANRVFVVALDRGSAWDSARKTWEHAGFQVIKLGNRAPNEIGASMAKAVMQATGEKQR